LGSAAHNRTGLFHFLSGKIPFKGKRLAVNALNYTTENEKIKYRASIEGFFPSIQLTSVPPITEPERLTTSWKVARPFSRRGHRTLLTEGSLDNTHVRL